MSAGVGFERFESGDMGRRSRTRRAQCTAYRPRRNCTKPQRKIGGATEVVAPPRDVRTKKRVAVARKRTNCKSLGVRAGRDRSLELHHGSEIQCHVPVELQLPRRL